MVWNSTQSALYRAIDRHNGGCAEDDFRREENVEKSVGKPCGDHEPKNSENYVRKEPKKRCENCPKNRAHNVPSDPISRIMSDRDMMLIAGLIFILLKENADKTLILALVIVLLG